MDERLKWEPEKFGLSRIRLHTLRVGEMWYPKFALNYLYGVTYPVTEKDDFRMNIIPIIRSDGNVSMQTTISISEQIQLDYSKYPYDRQNLCFPQQLDTVEILI